MIDIGNNVHITAFVKILQHGYDWAVLQEKYGRVLGSSGLVKIGNNVFIGQNTTILKGSIIGDNVIIGANSLVNKKLDSNSVYAGIPARKICSLDEYLEKREQFQLQEATDLVIQYYKKYSRFPKKELLREFFWLFENDYNELCDTFKEVLSLSNKEGTILEFKKHNSLFNNYDEFIDYVKKYI